jgi:hypothetical protein
MPQPAPPPVRPLALTDSEYDQVMAAARPLHELRGLGELGDGRVHRAIAEVQRRYWDPPIATGHRHAGKYR